ncbi:copper homeostasis protein CutC [Sphingobacterium sp. SRCM116780]|uniref:copper homeostasis protein CutC n=1 Tax=Sphingobacterium sp. SRCM116780 TaxID=2907623 RepID=UPI001F2C65B7|nr:copper homeostasis protein CutC [Sphingobacterium sp. SRCM116780]UIR54720.1 copper homeostasis protein CutC [Sphingobacterium sp. SRCM116780]
MGKEISINKYQLEICANSPQSALYAAQGGATRVELCQNLENGGTTPSYGQIVLARKLVDIGIHVLIRPRGGDFVYSTLEFEEMIADIQFCKESGCDGVVIGVMERNGMVDIERTKTLVEAARPMHVTFHRAFDKCVDPFASLAILMDLKIDRVLTSGLRNKAIEGVDLLKQLVDYAAGKIVIMPGASVDNTNIAEILERTGAIAIHTSAKETLLSEMTYDRVEVAGMNESIYSTSKEKVHQLVDILKKQ